MLKKNLVVFFICVSFFAAKSFAFDEQVDNPAPTVSPVCKSETPAFVIQDNFDQNKLNQCAQSGPEQVAQRGCCSHHHGVCGCSPDGRAQCCDGSLSPSCGC